MPTLHIRTPNPTLYIAFLTLGLLSAIKSGVISPEAGIWTLRMPKNYDEILPHCPPKLQNIIECFDELDLLSRLDAVAYAQTIDRLLRDLQQIVAEHSEPYDAHLNVSG